MKTQISGIDLHYLIQELQILINGRIDKIYHPKKEELLIQIYLTGVGKKILRIIPGKFFFLSEFKENYDQPSGFCMFLRKHLDNAKIKSINQIGSERIVEIAIEKNETILYLYTEFFGKGNIILTDKDKIILNALQQKKWSDRTIKKGVLYKFPKKEFNLTEISKNEFSSIFKNNDEIVYVLAKNLGLGGTYAEELCQLTGIDKKNKKITDNIINKLYSEFTKLLKKRVKPTIYYTEGKVKDIRPFELKCYETLEKKSVKTLSQAFDELFKNEIAKDEFISKHQVVIDKTKKIIEQQKKQLESLGKKAHDNTKKAELIYENYKLIDDILKELNKARKKYSFDEIKEKLKGHKVIKSLDPKEKKIKVAVQ